MDVAGQQSSIFFCPFLMHFTTWKVDVGYLQKITAFVKLLWVPLFVALFMLLFQWTPHATLPQLPASLQISSTPFACWQWIPCSACDCWSRGSPPSIRKALHWAANTSAICCTEGCSCASAPEGTSQVTAVNALRLVLVLLREMLL